MRQIAGATPNYPPYPTSYHHPLPLPPIPSLEDRGRGGRARCCGRGRETEGVRVRYLGHVSPPGGGRSVGVLVLARVSYVMFRMPSSVAACIRASEISKLKSLSQGSCRNVPTVFHCSTWNTTLKWCSNVGTPALKGGFQQGVGTLWNSCGSEGWL